MSKMMKVFLAIACAGTLLESSGCLNKIAQYTEWGFNFTGILDNFGVLPG